MKLIEDLGKQAAGKKGHVYHFGVYECPICHTHFKVAIKSVKSGKTTKCKSCATKIYAAAKVKTVGEVFIRKAVEVHAYRYDYSKVEYTGSKHPIIVICKEHGEFLQSAGNHLRGAGCPECRKAVLHSMYSSTLEAFIEKAVQKYGYTYVYNKTTYINSDTKTTITCKIHGDFSISPHNFLSSKVGCALCAREQNSIATRLSRGGEGILYYVKLDKDGTTYYKIGVTANSVADRFYPRTLNGCTLTIIHTLDFLEIKNAYRLESLILCKFKQYKTTDKPLTSGNTEVFSVDILEGIEHFTESTLYNILEPN